MRRAAAAALAAALSVASPLPAQAREPGQLPHVAGDEPLANGLAGGSLMAAPVTPVRIIQHRELSRGSLVHRQEIPDPWFGPDKVRHFFTSAAVQSLGYGALRSADVDHRESLLGASVVTAILGLGKELSDRRRGYGFSVRDLVWDAAGAAAISVMLTNTIR